MKWLTFRSRGWLLSMKVNTGVILKYLFRFVAGVLSGLALLCAAQAQAQQEDTLTLSPLAATAVRTMTTSIAPETGRASDAATPATAGATVAPQVSVTTPLGCRPATDQAMSADLAAVKAQSQKIDLTEQASLFRDAMAFWTRAESECAGHAKERAQRNRADDQQMLARVLEQLDSGPQCASSQKDAASLQDIAKQTLTERRWAEAASLFRKAESMWDYAAERCSGSRQEVANRRRDQSAQDAHNAQYCAPLFEKAREFSQKLRGATASLSKADKAEQQMVAETLWRDALGQCRGAAVQEIAANNANALARDRGTPWVPRLAAAEVSVTPVKPVTLSGTASAGALAPHAAPELHATALADANPSKLNLAAVASSKESSVAPVKSVAPEPTQLEPGNLSAGDTQFVGKFYRDAEATTISGSGKVTWASGDVFEGTQVRGKRQGLGVFTWANGQRYEGDWVDGKPTGQAKLHFVNGNDYEGAVVDGIPQGAGRLRYVSGDVFEGQFKNGEPAQTGTYVWRNGQRYEGAWQQGRPNGDGKLKFVGGNAYEGGVVDGKPQGMGRMVFAGGEVYEGQFQAGEPHGEGTFNWPNGDRYAGHWAMGKKHGHGVFTWKSGERWEGEYDNDAQKN